MRSTTVMFGMLFVAATAATAQDKMGSVSKGDKGSSSTSSSGSSASAPSTISKGTSSSPSFGGSSSSKSSIYNSTSNHAPRVYKGDTRTWSNYSRPSMLPQLLDRESQAFQKERADLRESLAIKEFLQRVNAELALKQKDEPITPNKASTGTKTLAASSSVDIDPPAVPPTPHKNVRFEPTKSNIPINGGIGNVGYYPSWYDSYLLNNYYNSFYGICSPFSSWRRSLSPYGYSSRFLSRMNRYGFSDGLSTHEWMMMRAMYMNSGWYGGYGSMYWRPYSSMAFGYGMGGIGSFGCGSFYGYGPDYMDRDNHFDRCALVTVDTYGDAKYQLRINLGGTKIDTAEDLEEQLNKQLEKGETIFLTDEEGYELQLTPGTAKKIRVDHCEER